MPTIWLSYATSAQEAEQALKIVRQWMQQANLQLHPEKKRVVNLRAGCGRSARPVRREGS